MKAVLISIQPKWCELIASGVKTVEVRKTRPKLETPFKCYVYCTKGIPLMKTADNSFFIDNDYRESDNLYGLYELENGKVMCEFVCDRIDEHPYLGEYYTVTDNDFKSACISYREMKEYAKKKKSMYFWHISDLVIYDKPKELSEFYRHDNSYDNAFGWAFEDREKNIPITRPPQSWFYIEERSEGKRC